MRRKGPKRLDFPRLESGWKVAGNRLATLKVSGGIGQAAGRVTGGLFIG